MIIYYYLLILWTYVWPKLPITTQKYKNLFSRLQNNCSFTPKYLLCSLQFYVKNPWMKFLDVAIHMKPLQLYHCDWPNTNARQEMAKSTISLWNNFYRRNIKSTGTATCIMYSTDYYQWLTLESWFTNLEQTLLNRNQQFLAPFKRLIDKINRMTGELTVWLTMDGCLTVTIDGSKCNNYITLSLHS